MKRTTRLPAYTILEVTIAMLLAAITIGITYTAYTMISRSYRTFDEKNKQLALFIRVDQLLKKDIQSAEVLTRLSEGIELEDSHGKITYQFTPAYILRDQYSLATDTFFIASQELQTLFESKEITEEGERLDQVMLSVILESRTVPLFYTKHYSSAALFTNQNP